MSLSFGGLSALESLLLVWLAVWLIAVVSYGVPIWWVIAFCGLSFCALTWRMAHVGALAKIGLKPADVMFSWIAVAAAVGVFLGFWLYVKMWHLPVYGPVPLIRFVWSVGVAPLNEELVFRGLLFSFLEKQLLRLGDGVFAGIAAVLIAGLIFGVMHSRSGVYLAFTVTAGCVYGLLRWRSGSVLPAVICHACLNVLVLSAFRRG
ncbi:CPBP family intramembrane glutamic endopeptidase [Acidisarcina polymorpha]|nr:CPBP family intramembrane glutamic endopeptidase [Acidisarcina polymorpha]